MSRIVFNADALREDARKYAKSKKSCYSTILLSAKLPNSIVANSKTQYLRDCIKKNIDIPDVEHCIWGSMEEEKYYEVCNVFQLNPEQYLYVEEPEVEKVVEETIVEKDEILSAIDTLNENITNIGKIQSQICQYLCEIVTLLK